MTTIRWVDVLYFLAEIGVYVAVAWWAFTRDVPSPVRWALGIVVIGVFAVSWALFAAPTASMPLTGMADVIFRLAWFGIGVTAAILVVSHSGLGIPTR